MSRRKSEPVESNSGRAPARTPEDRENQIASLAFDLVESRLRAGTASSQETIWALKLGTTREAIEKQKLAAEAILVETKRTLMEAQKENEGLYGQAIAAFRAYSGDAPPAEESDYDDFED